MTMKTAAGRRWASTAILAVLGGVAALAAWAGNEPYLAIMLGVFYLLCGLATYLWSRGRGDVAAVLRLSGDERQRQVDLKATAAAGMAALAFSFGGAVLDLARGGTGNPWALICAVGGLSYVAAFGYFRYRV